MSSRSRRHRRLSPVRCANDVLLAVLLTVPVVVLILVVVLMVNQRRTQAPRNGRRAGESPRDILDRRYAAGELSRDQYRQAPKTSTADVVRYPTRRARRGMCGA